MGFRQNPQPHLERVGGNLGFLRGTQDEVGLVRGVSRAAGKDRGG